MHLYTNSNGKLQFVKEVGFKLEREMQFLAENNLGEVFGLEFISSEFQMNNLRIDTLGFDVETNSFVIIEYKMKGQNLDIAQGLAYLSLLLNNKAEFVQKLSILKNTVIRNEHIDWTQSRVIFVSENFTEHQKESINFKDLPISLYEMKQLINGEIVFNEIKAKNKTESIKTVTKGDDKFLQVEKEIETFDEAHHLEGKSQKIVELYEKIKTYITELDPNFEIVYRKMYIAFKLNKRNIVSMHLFVNSINIWLYGEYGTIRDEYALIRDVSNTGNYGSAENEVKIDSDENLLRVLVLIQQAYNNKSK